MNRLFLRSGILVLAIVLAWPWRCGAQVPVGVPLFGSFGGGPDIINMADLNVHYQIPIRQKNGLAPFYYILTYDGSVWQPVGTSGNQTWQPTPAWGWQVLTPLVAGLVTFSQTQEMCTDISGDSYNYNLYSNFLYTDPGGVVHQAPAGFEISDKVDAAPNCKPGGAPPTETSVIYDDYGYTIYANININNKYDNDYYPTVTVYSRSGTVILPSIAEPNPPSTNSVTNSDSNSITVSTSSGTSTYTDSLNTTALTVTGTGIPSSPYTYTYTGGSGSVSAYTKYTGFNILTNFGCSGISEFSASNVSLVSEIDLADGSKYTFGYEVTPGHSGYYTGRLASVTLPTGGEITYAYSGGANGITCADGSAATIKRVTPDTGSSSWQYAHSESGSAWTTTVTDPLGNVTTYDFQKAQGNENIYETERQVGSLATVVTCYNNNPSPCTSASNTTSINLPLAQRTVMTTLGSVTSETNTTYNTYGLPTETDEYTYGPTLVRKTIPTYTSCGVTNTYVLDRPCSVKVYDGGGTERAENDNTYDANGDLVTETHSTGGTPATISRSFTYTANGALETATDFNGHELSVTSSDCAGSTAFPATLVRGGLTTTLTWDCNGGVVTQVVDPNTRSMTMQHNDPFWRVTEVSYPDGGQISTTYNDTQGDFSVVTSVLVSSGVSHETTLLLDGLGRVQHSQDNSAATYVDTTYDKLGRVASVSNPYYTQSDPSYGVTTFSYDALNRLEGTGAITRPDANEVGVTYSSNCATTTDEASKARATCTDALGRVTSVTEDPSGLDYSTTYTYDALNDLTGVAQGSNQTRTYGYDWLSRLTSASTPESATTTYAYASSGSLCSGDPSEVCSRTNARGTTTTYAYDTLNRLTGKSYSDTTPPVTLSYDQTSVTIGSWSSGTLSNPKGRLTEAVTTSSGNVQTGVVYSYDSMGRPTDYWACTPSNCGSSSIPKLVNNYDLAGDVASWVHPAGFTITNSISAAQRVTEVSSSLNSSTQPPVLAENIAYTAWGALSSRTNTCEGTGCTDALESYYYNKRMQPVSLQLGTTTNASADYCMVYNYYLGVSNPTSCVSYPTTATSGNNSNVIGLYDLDAQNNSLMTDTEAYSYDKVNRLTSGAATGNATYNLTFSYTQDGSGGNYGNMSCLTNGQTEGLCPNYSFNASTDHISTAGFTYDAAGDLTSDGTHSYTWDAEGRLLTMDGGTTANITYNALGQMAHNLTLDTYYNPAGQRIAGGGYNIVPWGNVALVKYGTNTNFVHGNTVQSSTVVTDQTGAVLQDLLFYPWGQSWIEHDGSVDGTFATMIPLATATGEETGITPFRNYSESYGRWLSPDPAGMNAVNLSDPQTWNAYVYARNNPTTMIDPYGLTCVQDDDGNTVDNLDGNGCSELTGDSPEGLVVIGGPYQITVTGTASGAEPVDGGNADGTTAGLGGFGGRRESQAAAWCRCGPYRRAADCDSSAWRRSSAHPCAP